MKQNKTELPTGADEYDSGEKLDHQYRPKHSIMIDVSKTQRWKKWGHYLCAEVTVARKLTQKGLPDSIPGEFILKARKHHDDGSQSKWVVIAWGSFIEGMQQLRKYESESPEEIVTDIQTMSDAGLTIY